MTYLGYDDNFHQSWTMMGNTLSLESNNHDDQKLDSLSCSLFLHHTFSLPCSSRLWRFLKYDVGMFIWEPSMCVVFQRNHYTLTFTFPVKQLKWGYMVYYIRSVIIVLSQGISKEIWKKWLWCKKNHLHHHHGYDENQPHNNNHNHSSKI